MFIKNDVRNGVQNMQTRNNDLGKERPVREEEFRGRVSTVSTERVSTVAKAVRHREY